MECCLRIFTGSQFSLPVKDLIAISPSIALQMQKRERSDDFQWQAAQAWFLGSLYFNLKV